MEPKFGGHKSKGERSPVALRQSTATSNVVRANAYGMPPSQHKTKSQVTLVTNQDIIGNSQELPAHHLDTNEEERDFEINSNAIQQFFNVLDNKGNIVSRKIQPP